MQPDGNLVVGTLKLAFGQMLSFFAPVLIPLGVIALVAFAAWLYRRFTNVG